MLCSYLLLCVSPVAPVLVRLAPTTHIRVFLRQIRHLHIRQRCRCLSPLVETQQSRPHKAAHQPPHPEQQLGPSMLVHQQHQGRLPLHTRCQAVGHMVTGSNASRCPTGIVAGRSHPCCWWHHRHWYTGHRRQLLQVLQHHALDALQLSTCVAVLHVADLWTTVMVGVVYMLATGHKNTVINQEQYTCCIALGAARGRACSQAFAI